MDITKPVFFIGMPRSGTTILYEYFSQHEQLAWLSRYSNYIPGIQAVELLTRVFDHQAINLRASKAQGQMTNWYEKLLPRPTEGYPFWNHYCGEIFLWDGHPETSLTERTEKEVRKAIQRILRYRGKARFTAKFTGPSRMEYLGRIFPDALFFHVIRDGRAVVDSLLRVPFWKEKGGYEAPFWKHLLTEQDKNILKRYEAVPVALASLQWRRVIRETRKQAKQIASERYMEIRYEDFVSDPLGLLIEVNAYAGLPFSDRVSRYIEDRKGLKNMNYKYLDMSESARNIMREIMSDTLQECGYQLDRLI